MEKKDILKGIRKKGIYDFISNEGYNLTKEQLITIIKEIDFELYNFCEKYDGYFKNNITYKNRVNNILKELDEMLY